MIANKTLYTCFVALAFCALGVSLAALYTASRICSALDDDISSVSKIPYVTDAVTLDSPYETVGGVPTPPVPSTESLYSDDNSCVSADNSVFLAPQYTLTEYNGVLRICDADGSVLFEYALDITQLNRADREQLDTGISCSDISVLRRIASDLIS